MAVISDIPKSASIRERIFRRIDDIFENYLRARATSITIRELNKLSDRDLADLGMSRSEIISRAKVASSKN